MAVKSLDNWSGSQALDTSGSSNDPLVEQINIIKGYVKQAREAMRFEEVNLYCTLSLSPNNIFYIVLFVSFSGRNIGIKFARTSRGILQSSTSKGTTKSIEFK